jgi:xanthine dehydrogenase small subunit
MSAHAHAPAGLERTEMVRPKTIAEACAALAQATREKRTATLLAGGTDVIVDRHLMPIEKAHAIDVVVDVTGVAELGAIEERDVHGEKHLVLGGGVTYWQLRTDRRVVSAIPMLDVMARDVGAVQIQTRGTLAGNIATASPAADGVPALMALEGVVTLVKEGGTRTVPLEQFFLAYRKTALLPGELIAAIDVRVPKPGARVLWRKVGTRLAQAISKVALASVVEEERGTITRAAFGMASVAAVTHPLGTVRALAVGKNAKTLDRAAVDAAIDLEIKPIDDVRSTGEYRLHVAKALVWRALAP